MTREVDAYRLIHTIPHVKVTTLECSCPVFRNQRQSPGSSLVIGNICQEFTDTPMAAEPIRFKALTRRGSIVAGATFKLT